MKIQLAHTAIAIGSVAVVTWLYTGVIHVTDHTIVALTFLLIVLVTATTSRLWIAVAASISAMLAFNFFFLPPVGTLSIAEPQNWVALFTFLAVSLVASNLSSAVRARERVALERRDEMGRLFELSRDVLQMTDSEEAVSSLPAIVARRFGFGDVAVRLPGENVPEVFAFGDPSNVSRQVPLRVGSRQIGVLGVGGRPVEEGTLEALGGLVAIAIERAQLLEARNAAALAKQSEELKSALLASLGHDLRTPLTAIRVAAGNLQASWLTEGERNDQAGLVLAEVERLNRLFQNILEMARIDAGALSAQERWVHLAEIVEAARDLVPEALRGHIVTVDVAAEVLVKLDPRLTTAALSHLLENAAHYSGPDAPIEVTGNVSDEQTRLTVRDHGPGVAAADLPRLFERFYRGSEARARISGTGMGLSIARGLVAAERGRIWAENAAGGGAAFTIALDAESRRADAALVNVDA